VRRGRGWQGWRDENHGDVSGAQSVATNAGLSYQFWCAVTSTVGPAPTGDRLQVPRTLAGRAASRSPARAVPADSQPLVVAGLGDGAATDIECGQVHRFHGQSSPANDPPSISPAHRLKLRRGSGRERSRIHGLPRGDRRRVGAELDFGLGRGIARQGEREQERDRGGRGMSAPPGGRRTPSPSTGRSDDYPPLRRRPTVPGFDPGRLLGRRAPPTSTDPS
jgi:hypothetical protein